MQMIDHTVTDADLPRGQQGQGRPASMNSDLLYLHERENQKNTNLAQGPLQT